MSKTEPDRTSITSISELVDELEAAVSDSVDESLGEQNADDVRSLLSRLDAVTKGFKERMRLELKEEGSVSLEQAKEIMGRDFLGPEACKKTFGRELKPQEIPAIPFSKEDLEKARELGQFLTLRMDKAAHGSGLNMEKQKNLLEQRFEIERKGKILYNTDWYKDEAFFTQDTPKLRWALVTKEVIPGSENKNAVAQTRIVADYVINQVFKDQELPPEYAPAIREFEDQEAELTELMRSDWQECNKRLAALKLNQMCRRTPVEALSDLETYFDNTGTRLLPNTYDRTKRLSSFARLVLIGLAGSAGADVDRWDPDGASPYVGVVFSRSL